MRIVKTKTYERQAKNALSKSEQRTVDEVIARTAGRWEVVAGTGGARKARIRLHNNKGQSGGARVIYFYLTADETVILLACYTKAKKETISDREKAEYKAAKSAFRNAVRKRR